MTEQQLAHPKYTVPRSAGQRRAISRIQPGWWIHLEPVSGAPEGTTPEWVRLKSWFSFNNRAHRTLVFYAPEGAENAITVHKDDQAVSLTEREAAKLGLTPETAVVQ